MDIAEFYMSRCLDLAGRGRGNVNPNPMVGAVIVCDGHIIGEGYHRCYGEAHAEVNAIESVKDESMLQRSTLYVNLEPCSHYGKTPPCAELIIRKGIPRVVIACSDPYPEVAGRGIKMLREAGVEVVSGIMESEATSLNRYFMTANKKHRPYIILKWAQSTDGFIDNVRKDASVKPVMLSNPISRMMVHKLRSEVQAIMVGTNTALLDNPSLTVRYWRGKSPVRVLIDSDLRVSGDCNLYDGARRTIVFTKKISESINTDFSDKRNIEYIEMDSDIHFLINITKRLYDKNICSLLVEGGAKLHRSFMEEGLWDEIIVETTPLLISNGVMSASFQGIDGVRLSEKKMVPKFSSLSENPSVIERYINCTV